METHADSLAIKVVVSPTRAERGGYPVERTGRT